MAKKTFNLTNVSVKSGEFNFPSDSVEKIDGTSFEKGEKAGTVATKNGILYAVGDDLYDFKALTGGEFEFVSGSGNNSASVRSFDGSGVVSAISVTVGGTGTEELATVTTGAGKDFVSVKAVDGGVIDLGAGNDTIIFTDNGTKDTTVELGAGADLVSVDGSKTVSVSVSDYNYADGDRITINSASASELKYFDYEKGQASIQGGSAQVLATTALNNGVYELNLNDSVFVRTNVSSVEYAATQAIDFASTADTTTLNLTLAGKNANKNIVSVGAAEGTVNIVAGRAQADITVETGVNFGLVIEKKGAQVSVKNVLDADDTLYLMDGGKISDVKFAAGVAGDFAYGDTTVKSGYDSAAEGTFKYNINGEEGVLAYGNTNKVTYADGVTYYANAETVDAGEYEGDVVLNLNGVCGDAFADKVSVVSGVVSGLVAGRNKVNTTVFAATEASKKTEIYGGVAGNDSISLNDVDSDSTNVIWYSNGDGKDTVSGFTKKGDNSVYFHDAAAAASILNEVAKVSNNDLTIAMDKKNVLTLAGVKAATGETNVINFKDVAGNTFKVAVGDGKDVTYASGVNIYKGATTLKVEGKEDMIIYTGASNDQYGYYDGITAINASEASGTLYLSGTNENGMTITGGTGTNHMWGGGDKMQKLVANDDAVNNVFWFGAGDGRDTAKDADGEDGVNLYNVEKIDDVAIKASTSYFTVTVGNDSLKVDLATGTTAEDALKTFTFADKAGVLYTYNTETNKFQQK